MKKIVMAMVLMLGVGIIGSQFSEADPRGGGGGCNGPCGGPYGEYAGGPGGSEENVKAREKFLTETQDLRREIAVKQAEFSALMQQTNPDETKAGKLRGEIFDIQTKLQQKAKEAGLPATGFGCNGPGFRGHEHGPDRE